MTPGSSTSYDTAAHRDRVGLAGEVGAGFDDASASRSRRPAGRRGTRRCAVGAVALMLVAGACGSSGVTSGSSGAADATTTVGGRYGAATTLAGAAATTAVPSVAPTTTAAPTAAPTGGSAVLGLGDTPAGKVLVDAEGMTLYLYEPDTATAIKCDAGCAGGWPPLAGPMTAGPGIDATKLGVATRPDGSVQATYGGHPLYRFAGDAKAGESNGQELGGVWYVLGASGAAIEG